MLKQSEIPKEIKLIFCVSLGCTVIPILFYIVRFWDLTFSDDPEDWSTFSNFFGNIYTAIFSFFNLVFFVFISTYIHNNNNIEKNKDFIKNKKLEALEYVGVHNLSLGFDNFISNIKQLKFIQEQYRSQSGPVAKEIFYLNLNNKNQCIKEFTATIYSFFRFRQTHLHYFVNTQISKKYKILENTSNKFLTDISKHNSLDILCSKLNVFESDFKEFIELIKDEIENK